MKHSKKPLLTLIIFISFLGSAWAQEDLVPSEKAQAFLKRLELFELIPPQRKEVSKEPRHTSRRDQRSALPQELLRQLQGDLETAYLDGAQEILGHCAEGNCLQENSFGGREFVDEAGKRHCYPYTNCEYYRCMEKEYRCLDVGVEYFANLAKPTCEAYVSNIKKGKFSSKGKDWIFNVMVCLQKGLFDECALKGNCPQSESNEKTCQHITEFTLKFHPGCYIKSGVGVCKLPLKDQINIWRTVGPFLTDRERIEAYKVVRYCLFKTPIE